ADSLSKPSNPEQIVADSPTRLAEIVEYTRLDILRRVRGEERSHADRELVLPPQFERVFLVLKIARVDDSSQPKAVCMGVQFCCSAKSVFWRLRSLERGYGCIRCRDHTRRVVNGNPLGDQE